MGFILYVNMFYRVVNYFFGNIGYSFIRFIYFLVRSGLVGGSYGNFIYYKWVYFRCIKYIGNYGMKGIVVKWYSLDLYKLVFCWKCVMIV